MTTYFALLRSLLRVASMVFVLGAALAARADVITYYHNDLLGSPRVATNQSGAVVWTETFTPHGERMNGQLTANKIWYTSRHQDDDTGLVYIGARYYDPVTGRFMGVDPKQFQETNIHSFNRYSYASNNPYLFIDPDGREVRLFARLAAQPAGAITNPDSYHLTVWMAANDKSVPPMTIEGQPGGGKLRIEYNKDGPFPASSPFYVVVPTPEGMSDNEFIRRIREAALKYQLDLVKYSFPDISFIPGNKDGEMKSGEYNSNSIASGLIKAAGGTPPKIVFPDTVGPGQTPGYDNPVPIR